MQALSAQCSSSARMSCMRQPSLRSQCRPISSVRPARRAAPRVNALFGGNKPQEGGGGGSNNPFDMKNLMESVKKAQGLVQQETNRVQAELSATEFEGFDEDETVRVVMTGNQAPKSVDITQEAMDAGKEELAKRVTAAMQDSHTKSVAGMKEKMQSLARTLGIPNPDQMNL